MQSAGGFFSNVEYIYIRQTKILYINHNNEMCIDQGILIAFPIKI